MNISLPRAMLLVALATLIGVGTHRPAHAAPLTGPAMLKLQLPAVAPAKLNLAKLAPKVKFKASGGLKGGKASIKLTAQISVAGKTFKVNVLDMGLAKTKKSVTVKRKIGKLKVSLRVSWSGEREIKIKGSARYLKFKVPMPTIKIRL